MNRETKQDLRRMFTEGHINNSGPVQEEVGDSSPQSILDSLAKDLYVHLDRKGLSPATLRLVQDTTQGIQITDREKVASRKLPDPTLGIAQEFMSNLVVTVTASPIVLSDGDVIFCRVAIRYEFEHFNGLMGEGRRYSSNGRTLTAWAGSRNGGPTQYGDDTSTLR